MRQIQMMTQMKDMMEDHKRQQLKQCWKCIPNGMEMALSVGLDRFDLCDDHLPIGVSWQAVQEAKDRDDEEHRAECIYSFEPSAKCIRCYDDFVARWE